MSDSNEINLLSFTQDKEVLLTKIIEEIENKWDLINKFWLDKQKEEKIINLFIKKYH